MNRLVILLPLFAMFSAAQPGPLAADSAPSAEKLLRAKRPLVIAHRGFSAIAPENTLPAFERALATGADLIELDYHHSKDGALMVLHDATLDRTTDAAQRWSGSKLRVADFTLSQLRELQTGLWFNPPYPGARLPTLDEALTVIQNGGVTLIERKAGDAASCVSLLRRNNLVNHVVVQAFDWDYLREFHQLEPAQILGALGPPSSRGGLTLSAEEKRLSPLWLDRIEQTGARVVVWNKEVDAASVQAAHERGLKVWIYTINEEPLARHLLRLGVDGIITDHPAIAWKALALEALESPRQSP